MSNFSGARCRDRHAGLTKEEAEKRVLKPMIFECYYMNKTNKYAVRRVPQLHLLPGFGTETGRLPCPGNYSRQENFLTRMESGIPLSENVKSARTLLQSMDQIREIENNRKNELDRVQNSCTTKVDDANIRPSSLLKTTTGNLSCAASSRSKNRSARSSLAATPENGKLLVTKAEHKVDKFLEKLTDLHKRSKSTSSPVVFTFSGDHT